MRVSPQFVSVGVNRVVNALDWGDNGLIAFCGHRIVCVYDPESAEVIGTLTGHTGQVNCVKWLPSSVTGCSTPVLLSGAADNTIRVWAWNGQQQSPPWTCITVLQGHESPVTSLALQPLSQDVLLLASTSADPHVRLWECHHPSKSPQQQQQQDVQGCSVQEQQLQVRFGAAAWRVQQPVHVGRQIQHCVALATLPEDPHCVLMATGGTDSTVRLYVREGSSCADIAPSTDSTCAGTPNGHAGVLQENLQDSLGGKDTMPAQSPCFQLQCQLKGHENWVKGVSFQHVQESAGPHAGQHGCVSLLLASAGQDRYGRIWCISTDPNRSNAAADGAGGIGGAAAGDDILRKMITRYAPRPHLSAGSRTYWVTLEALLIGHEDWLHSVSWRPTATQTASPASAAAAAAAAANSSCNGNGDLPAAPSRSELTLLTTSQDRSMMLWSFDAPNELWLSDAAIGDAGASCLGFYGGAFNPSGDQLVAHGFTGALHLWKQQGGHGSSGSSSSGGLWVPQHALGGHYGAVQDLAWGADGACLHTVATDQTARLFTGIRGHWFELARTQVHGHDFSCLATIPSSSSSSSGPASNLSTGNSSSTQDQWPPACLLYVSGSEEKVLRVFEAPHAFTQSLAAVRSLQSPAAAAATAAALAAAAAAAGSSGSTAGRALGAAVAALGLSNKAVYDDAEAGPDDGTAGGDGARLTVGAESYNEGPDFVPVAVPAVVSGPPLEEHLAQNTLWPEVRKLYGHGNDVFCVCASPSGRVIASTCRAQSAGAAAVWVWEVGSWKALAQLSAHTLTVTQAEFSPDGRYLLTGSRDRSFCVWQVPQQYRCSDAAAAAAAAGAEFSDEGSAAFELLCRQKAAHSRIIWSVSWAHDGSFFATGSRDNTVKLWALSSVGTQQQQRPIATLPPFSAGITAVALSPCPVSAAAAAAGGDAAQQGSAAAGSAAALSAAAEQVHVLAVGMEDGCVQVWRLRVQGTAAVPTAPAAGGEAGGQGVPQVVCERLWGSEVWQQHAAAVRRLRWAPACVSWLCDGGDGGIALASCGEDNSVRVFDVRL